MLKYYQKRLQIKIYVCQMAELVILISVVFAPATIYNDDYFADLIYEKF